MFIRNIANSRSACIADFRNLSYIRISYSHDPPGGGAQSSGARWLKECQVSRSVVIAMTARTRFLSIGCILMHGTVSLI